MTRTPVLATLVLLFTLITGLAHAQDPTVNINTADVATLASLDGIGESKARAIIEYREAHGRSPAPTTWPRSRASAPAPSRRTRSG